MLDFHTKYRPLTSRPFLSNHTYAEYPPCQALKPYISCYWTTSGPENMPETGEGGGVLVIPDTCVDLMITVNHTRQKITGRWCGMQDHSYVTERRLATGERISSFAVRFHFWAAHLFLNLDFRELYNQVLDAEAVQREWMTVFEPFFYVLDVKERIQLVEKLLAAKLDEGRVNHNLFNSFQQILSSSGTAAVKEICRYSCISQRQLERQFLQQVGMTIKRTSNLVRYQNVWRDVARSEQFGIQDAVYRYGYADQSHLLKEFKRFHGVTPEQARQIALSNR